MKNRKEEGGGGRVKYILLLLTLGPEMKNS